MLNRPCPITKAAEVLGKKWSFEMIYYLRERKRFCELQEIVGGVNPTTLTQRLKVLEQAGIIQRYAISNTPRHVEYDLTEKGRDLLSELATLEGWVRRWYPVEEN